MVDVNEYIGAPFVVNKETRVGSFLMEVVFFEPAGGVPKYPYKGTKGPLKGYQRRVPKYPYKGTGYPYKGILVPL